MSTYTLAHSPQLGKTFAIIDRSATLHSVGADPDGRPLVLTLSRLTGYYDILGISVAALSADSPDIIAFKLADGSYLAGDAALFKAVEDCEDTLFQKCRNVSVAALAVYGSFEELIGR